MRLRGYLEKINFYSDTNDPSTIYAEFTVPPIGANSVPYKLFVGIEDEKLKSYIRQIILPNITDKVSITDMLTDIKDTIALGGNPDVVSPRVRTAGTLLQGHIEYDLNNAEHEYVRVSPDGWEIIKKPRNKFLKRTTSGTQVKPQPTTKSLPSLLKPFVNADREGLILFATWSVQAFCEGNHSALLVMAEQGCGKSTLTKMAQRIIDPYKGQPSVMPIKKDDLFTMLSNAYFVAFDNTDVLSKEISDILCSAVTGATVQKRKLYTTNELGLYELHNTLVLNGIDIVPTESDLASRCLLLKLKPIKAEKRKTDTELREDFQNTLPEILGAIFNVLSEAMKIIQDIHPVQMPRMAESYKEMLAIAVAMGIHETEFEAIYNANLMAMDKARADVAIVEAVKEYMESPLVTGRKVSGTATDLFNKIRSNYSGSKSDIANSVSSFSRKLRREYRVLYEAGYTINFDNTGDSYSRIEILKNK